MSLYWGILLIATIVIELVTVNLVTIWFAVGALGGLIVALLAGPLWLQITVFVVLSAAALLVTRPLVKKLVKPKIEPTNADRMIGKEGTVLMTVDPQKGEGLVNVEGNEWSATSEDGSIIENGSRVSIQEIRGVKVVCKKINL